MKRLSWNEFFMNVAILAAKRSRDNNTQVGACIVKDNKILSTGYNGAPREINDTLIPTAREGDLLHTKYPYIVHAELNAILNAPTTSLNDCILYVTLYPCCECAKAIIQTGIKTIYYLEDKHPEDDIYKAAKQLFYLAHINILKYEEEIL